VEISNLTEERDEWKESYFRYRNKFELTKCSLDEYVTELGRLKDFKRLVSAELENPSKTNHNKVRSIKHLLDKY